jgi:toxin HigB-1
MVIKYLTLIFTPLKFVTCNVIGYICLVIVSIKHKGLKLLWEKNNPSKLPPALVRRIKMILELMNSAKRVEDLAFPGADLHPLKGDLTGFWAIKVSGNYRIIFRFVEQEVLDIDYLDYH